MLSRTAEYALRAAVCLAQPSQPVCSSQLLADRTQIPRRYLHKVIQILVSEGLMDSQPGPGGGYSLAKPADEMTILDIVNAISPIQRITVCPLGHQHHTLLCPLHRELDKMYATIQESLSKVTISQLVPVEQSQILCEVKIKAGPKKRLVGGRPANKPKK